MSAYASIGDKSRATESCNVRGDETQECPLVLSTLFQVITCWNEEEDWIVKDMCSAMMEMSSYSGQRHNNSTATATAICLLPMSLTRHSVVDLSFDKCLELAAHLSPGCVRASLRNLHLEKLFCSQRYLRKSEDNNCIGLEPSTQALRGSRAFACQSLARHYRDTFVPAEVGHM